MLKIKTLMKNSSMLQSYETIDELKLCLNRMTLPYNVLKVRKLFLCCHISIFPPEVFGTTF